MNAALPLRIRRQAWALPAARRVERAHVLATSPAADPWGDDASLWPDLETGLPMRTLETLRARGLE